MLVYKATSPSGKSYVGITTSTLSSRKKSHKSTALSSTTNSPFHAAIRKYGFSTFSWDVLFSANSVEELKKKEIELIAELKTQNPYGYNLSLGGEGTFGHPAWNKGKKSSAATVEKLRNNSRKISIVAINTKTLSYTTYSSIAEAARELNINYTIAKTSVRTGYSCQCFKLVKVDDFDKNNLDKYKSKPSWNAKSIVCINLETKESIQVASINELSKKLSISERKARNLVYKNKCYNNWRLHE